MKFIQISILTFIMFLHYQNLLILHFWKKELISLIKYGGAANRSIPVSLIVIGSLPSVWQLVSETLRLFNNEIQENIPLEIEWRFRHETAEKRTMDLKRVVNWGHFNGSCCVALSYSVYQRALSFHQLFVFLLQTYLTYKMEAKLSEQTILVWYVCDTEYEESKNIRSVIQ